MFKHLFIAIILLSGVSVWGQRMISGKVSDGNTHELLPFVNVFINNTTVGTATDADGKYSLVIPYGEYEIVYSFVGYQSKKIRTVAGDLNHIQINIDLFSSEQQLENVTVQGTRDKEWKKLIKQFQKVFLGDATFAVNCIIQNAWSIDLKKEKINRRNTLTARASQPLEIENHHLGYRILYDMQNFAASRDRETFNGNAYFIELQPVDSAQARRWTQNRLAAYTGSSRHLFKSALQNRLKEEKFTLMSYLIDKNQAPGMKVYMPGLPAFDSLKRTYRIPIEQKIEIHYQGKEEAYSSMYFTHPYVEVNTQGVIVDPLSVIISGAMSKARMASLLPEDYEPTAVTDFTRISPEGGIASQNTTSPQILATLDSLRKKADRYSFNHPTEKIYLHFDKPFYVPGEISWYKAYIVDNDLTPSDISSLLYVDWITPAGKVVRHQRLKIDSTGAQGEISIDSAFHQGTYTVRAYTNWMRNDDSDLFYTGKIQVIDPLKQQSTSVRNKENKIDLQFFPEGGTFIAGISTLISFKAIDANGRSVPVKGQIIDDQNRILTSFESAHNGMGSFPFIGDAHHSLRAVLPSGEVFPFPVPEASGISLAVSNLNESDVRVRIQSSENFTDGVYLLAQSGGNIHYSEYIPFTSRSKDISISKDELPEGVLQLTLFNNLDLPVCERMLFIRKEKETVVTIQSNKEQYTPRDSISVNFQVQDRNGNPVQTSFSVSVTDADFTDINSDAENIYTRLLLQSDLKGVVENPGWYFTTPTLAKTFGLDLVMLTHGWSRYNWDKILHPTGTLLFHPEKGITLRGQITANKKPVVNTPFALIIPNAESKMVNVYETDSLGRFHISDLNFSDSTLTSWRVMGKKGALKNAVITLDETPDILPVTKVVTQDQIATGTRNESFEKLLARFIKTGVWTNGDTRLLDEVVIRANKIEVVAVGREQLVIKPTPEDLHASTSQFVYRYATKIPFFAEQKVDGIASWSGVVISINGSSGEIYEMGGNPTVVLNSIPIDQIEHVVVSGSAHHGYHISIKTNKADVPEHKSIDRIIIGYNPVREFYHPKYGPTDITLPGADNRITLYWNANLTTDKEGKATIQFYNTDTAQDFHIKAEGIANGEAITVTKTLGSADQ